MSVPADRTIRASVRLKRHFEQPLLEFHRQSPEFLRHYSESHLLLRYIYCIRIVRSCCNAGNLTRYTARRIADGHSISRGLPRSICPAVSTLAAHSGCPIGYGTATDSIGIIQYGHGPIPTANELFPTVLPPNKKTIHRRCIRCIAPKANTTVLYYARTPPDNPKIKTAPLPGLFLFGAGGGT